MAASRPIVHPTDFSSASRPAFAEAIAMAKLKKAPLVIVHVLPSLPIVPDAYVPPKTIVDLERAQQEHGKHELDRVVAKAKAARVPASGVLLEAGTPADQIVGVAKSKRADMIAMGTHGRSGIKRVLLGSVAARVVATATCPVLTVRGT